MNLDAVLARKFPPVRHRWAVRDVALYALALGFADDPLDTEQLPWVLEDARGDLPVLPGFAMTLGWPPFWQDDPATGIDWVHILHGEQHVSWHAPLPAAGEAFARHRILAVEDKGPGRGAVLHFGIDLEDARHGTPLASIRQVQFLRGDGGCGNWGEIPPACAPYPAVPSHAIRLALGTRASGALLYRWTTGDLMPIHARPQLARAAGFEHPIAHGLHTLGLVQRALVQHAGRGAVLGVHTLSARFVAPGIPGETLQVELQPDGSAWHFRVRSLDRGQLLVDRGRCAAGLGTSAAA